MVRLSWGVAGINPGRLPGGGRDGKERACLEDLRANPDPVPFWLWPWAWCSFLDSASSSVKWAHDRILLSLKVSLCDFSEAVHGKCQAQCLCSLVVGVIIIFIVCHQEVFQEGSASPNLMCVFVCMVVVGGR